MKGTSQKGITLVALIITIIILLILAVVAINAVNNTGIIGYAQNSADEYKDGRDKENGILQGYMEYLNENDPTKEKPQILERIYYVENEAWAEKYVTSEDQVPEGATITAKFYKTNTQMQVPQEFLQEIFGEEAPELEGYAYKLVIDGEGEVPTVIDDNEGIYAAWGKEILDFFGGEEVNPLAFYVTDAEIKGVSNVGNGAFTYNLSLSNVKLNESVTKINSYAFLLTSLQNINLENVTNIEPMAFMAAPKLKSITLPSKYTTVQEYAFYGSFLESIDLTNVTKIEHGAFYDCSNLVNIKFGDNTTEIGESAFGYCQNLQSIDLKNVTQIGYGVFSGCKALKSINLGNVTKIGENAFYGCTNLKDVNLSDNVKEVGLQAFYRMYIPRKYRFNKCYKNRR